jgi:hypothetical protein
MKLRRSAIAAVLVVTAAPALACRCRQLKLDEYFDRAEVVFLARALATWVVEEGEGAPGYRAVRFEAEGSPYKGDPSAFEQLATPLSSATCGYAVEVGRVYLVFAAAHEAGDRIAWFETCNGTRSFDADAPQGVEGFVDVEPKHVLAQLTARRTIAGGSGGRRCCRLAPVEQFEVEQIVSQLVEHAPVEVERHQAALASDFPGARETVRAAQVRLQALAGSTTRRIGSERSFVRPRMCS